MVITGDKGLAGAYNHNVLKLAHEWMEKSENNRLYVVGELGRQYFAARHMHGGRTSSVIPFRILLCTGHVS